MKKILQLVLSLTIISAVCAAVLAVVNSITKERIANLATLKANNAAKAVLPKGVVALDTRKDPADKAIEVFVAYSDAARKTVCGYAVPGSDPNGYGGTIRLMVGLTPDRKVITYQALYASETPGLGAKLTDKDFVKQFPGKGAAALAVKKDGGEIEAITGATITSRAVCNAIIDACRRVDRVEGKATAAPAAPAKAKPSPEGKMLFDPTSEKEAKIVLPKSTVTVVKLPGNDRFPILEGKDAAGKVTGYAVVGTGAAHGPNGDIVLHFLFAALPTRALNLRVPPRPVNQPGTDIADMEDAQRKAFNLAQQHAAGRLHGLKP